MSKKIELTPEQISECLCMYNEELLGSTTISERMKIHKTIIIRTLKENGVIFGPSGRRFIGGKSASDKRNYHKHKEKKSNNYKKWSKDKNDYLKEKHTKWREENREHVNQYARDYERKRRAEDPKYRLGVRTRTAVWQLLKERGIKKTNKTFELLGYTIEELMNHLEKQFVNGMTWENYGQWHVDHIRPMSSFNFTSTEDPEFKECWRLENLQPLWWPDNLSKGPRYL
jgi:AAA15 family ATPase/GTPase